MTSKSKTTISIPKKMVEQIQERAAIEKRSASAQVELWCEQALQGGAPVTVEDVARAAAIAGADEDFVRRLVRGLFSRL